jgi:hypothetical protein
VGQASATIAAHCGQRCGSRPVNQVGPDGQIEPACGREFAVAGELRHVVLRQPVDESPAQARPPQIMEFAVLNLGPLQEGEREGKDSVRRYFRGKRTMTEVPVCGSEVIATSPRCRRTISRAMAKPRPAPPNAWDREESTR